MDFSITNHQLLSRCRHVETEKKLNDENYTPEVTLLKLHSRMCTWIHFSNVINIPKH